MVPLVALGVTVFAGVIWLAISKKSSFKVRIAALVALGLMVLAVIVSIFIVFGVAVAVPDAGAMPEMPPPETPPPTAPGANNNVLLLFVFFLLAMFLLVLVLSLREQRKHRKMASAGDLFSNTALRR